MRDLFYNTPARLKFMKRDSAEATAIAGLVAHLALSHPEVSFKLIKDGTQTLLTPATARCAPPFTPLSGASSRSRSLRSRARTATWASRAL